MSRTVTLKNFEEYLRTHMYGESQDILVNLRADGSTVVSRRGLSALQNRIANTCKVFVIRIIIRLSKDLVPQRTAQAKRASSVKVQRLTKANQATVRSRFARASSRMADKWHLNIGVVTRGTLIRFEPHGTYMSNNALHKSISEALANELNLTVIDADIKCQQRNQACAWHATEMTKAYLDILRIYASGNSCVTAENTLAALDFLRALNTHPSWLTA